MCAYCHEALGLEYVAEAVHGRLELPESAILNWTLPVLIQEGVIASHHSEAPVSSWCLDAERAWLAGDDLPMFPPTDDHPLTSWRPPKRLKDADDATVAEAIDTIQRYLDWARTVPKSGAERSKMNADKTLADRFPTILAAWLVVQAHAPRHVLLPIAMELATRNFMATDEMLELWLQRRATLAWHDAEGMNKLLAAYGVSLRSHLVHYTILRRGITADETITLRALAGQHGESVEWALG